MLTKKNLKILLAISIIFPILCLMVLMSGCAKQEKKVPKIGIMQDKPQEWADALKLGFTDGLIEFGVDISEEVIIVPRSAMGDPQAFTTIAETFVRSDYSLIYTLGTQASQEIFNLSKTVPIVFGAVTDPVKVGFFKGDLKHPLANITGTQDLWPYPAQFDLVKTLLPKAKTVGIVYNSSEVNSQISVDFIKSECAKRDLLIEERAVASESEIQIAVSAILNKNVDLFFIPADNTAQTSAGTIIGMCNQKSIPVFTGIPGIVASGAIGTVGTNYYELGKVNAKQAYEILFEGKKAKDIPVSIADKGDIYLNLKAAKLLEITIPDELLKKAFKTYQ